MYDAAHKTIKKALKYAPTSGKVLHAQAKNFYFQKKYHKCIESGKMWLKHHPKSSEALLLIASSYYEMKQNVEALKFYEQALELDPTHAGVLVNTAVILNAFGRYEEAAHHSSKAVEISPNLVEVLLLAICVCVCVELHASNNLDPSDQEIEEFLFLNNIMRNLHCFKIFIGSSTYSYILVHLYLKCWSPYMAGNVKLYCVNSFVWLLLHAGSCEPCCSPYISAEVSASHEVTAKSIETTSTRQTNKVNTIHAAMCMCNRAHVHS